MNRATTSASSSVVLAGLESAGKSALFRGLTGHAAGDEANYRGSTVVCRRCQVPDCNCEVVDTPGIRTAADAETTRLALAETEGADVVLLVVRGTHLMREMEILLRELDLRGRRSAVVVTFKDLAPASVHAMVQHYQQSLQVPVVLVNARELATGERQALLQAIEEARPPGARWLEHPVTAGGLREERDPAATWFEYATAGPVLAASLAVGMFAGPVYLAWLAATWLQPVVERVLIAPAQALTVALSLPHWMQAPLTGGYGLLTLGVYSFLWAFPVVLLVGISVAVVEETGLKDRMAAALDPWLRRIGLDSRDLMPVLTGYGCNVVAVHQSRACGACSRRACVSLIAFGSACSYQIGATLSLFGSAGRPGLFLPYLLLLFLVGAVHTRLWHGRGRAHRQAPSTLTERAFLQWPSARAILWRVRAILKQFLLQAMPLFLGICVVAAGLDQLGVLTGVGQWLAPALRWVGLPAEAATALVLSVIRKDGMLALNAADGTILLAMSGRQVFVAVWLMSTFSACLVTLWTVGGELGWLAAWQLCWRQMVTAVGSAILISQL